MGDNLSAVLKSERSRPLSGSSQLKQAERMLEEARSELNRFDGLIRDRARERQRLEEELRAVTATGDVDRIMQLQARRTRFDEDTRGFDRRRADLEQGVDNKARYVEALKLSVENMKKEIEYLEERLQPEGYHAKRIQALEIDLDLARSGKASEENRLAQLRRQIWTIVGS